MMFVYMMYRVEVDVGGYLIVTKKKERGCFLMVTTNQLEFERWSVHYLSYMLYTYMYVCVCFIHPHVLYLYVVRQLFIRTSAWISCFRSSVLVQDLTLSRLWCVRCFFCFHFYHYYERRAVTMMIWWWWWWW